MKRPWQHSVVAKFFLSYFTIVLLLFAFFYFYTENLVREFYIASLSQKMEREARLLSHLLPPELEGDALDARLRSLAHDLETRVTVIRLDDGRVLGDSSERSMIMENHAARPEVIQARSSRSGRSIRYSTTVKSDMLYQAVLDPEGGRGRIIRIAVPLRAVQESSGSIRWPIFVGLFLLSGLGLILAFLFARRLGIRVRRMVAFSQRVSQGAADQPLLPVKGRDELSILESNLNEMSRGIREKINAVVAEKDKVESILKCMTEGVVAIDRHGRIIFLNENAQKMFNVPATRDLQGASLLEVSRHPEMKTLTKEILVCDCSRECFTKEICLDGGKWFRVNAVSLRDGGVRSGGFILVFHDVTELKRLETVRSDFVANVSHELRTPLTAIQGYVETLLHNPPADPLDSKLFLETIERHSERLGRLTEDLLTLSDLESGTLPLARKPVEVRYVIQGVIEVFRDPAAKKNVELLPVVASELPPVLGDPDRLQQLFINVVDNALKYTPAGGSVKITASQVISKEGAEPKIEIAVTDTGAGIPQKDLPRLTERFFRVDKARSRELGGTGLGLAIVKHIVQAHGGELKIDSVVQKGTTVRVILPSAPLEKRQGATLFLCTGNSCRSQMAEGFARQHSSQGHRVYSAGTAPKGIHPFAIQVMKEVGIDISTQQSKGLQAVPLDEMSRLITLCGDAAENCPAVPRKIERIHWPLRDPATAQGSQEEILRVFREVRDDIRQRVERLFVS